MTQSRNEVRTNLIDRSERFECNENEMIAAGDFNTFIFLAFGRRFSC